MKYLIKRSKIYWLIAILTIISMIIVGISLFLLYEYSFNQQKKQLADLVKSQASLVSSVVHYEKNWKLKNTDDSLKYNVFLATLRELQYAHVLQKIKGMNSEIAVAKIDGENLLFYLHDLHEDSDIPVLIPISSPNAEPMKLAIKGESGVMLALDIHGKQVLAAYEPVKELGLGIVANIHLSEIRKPFIRLGLIFISITLALIILGAFLISYIGNPIVDELFEKESQLENIHATLPGSIYQFVLHKDGRISIPYMSETINNLIGLNTRELIEDASKLYKIVHKDDRKSFISSLKKSAKKMETWEHVFRVTSTDNKSMWLYCRSNPSALPDGSILWNGVLLDVTKRSLTEMELRESKAFLKAVLDSIPVRVFWKDIDLNYLGCNIKFAQDAGVDNPKDIIGKSDYELNWKKQAELYQADDKIVIESGIGKINIEEPQTTPSGEQIYLLTSKVPLRNTDGQIIGVLGAYQDITELKKVEQTNKKLYNAIEHARETIVLTDVNGTIEYVNPAFEVTSGYSVTEAIGKNPRILKSGQHNDIFYKNMWKTLRNGDNWSGEIINKKKDGSLITESVIISPVFDTKKNIINYVAAKNDISETKRLQALESRSARLESMGVIAGQVAHDFNNLLAPIIAYPSFIKEKLPQSHKVVKYLDAIESAAKNIAEINQDLLTMGRRAHYNLEFLDMNSILSQSLKGLLSEDSKVTIKTNFCPDLMNIKGGNAQLSRVLLNLLVNALDAMDNDGVLTVQTENYYLDSLIISQGIIPKGEYVKITISDTGKGIPAEIIQNIFDPFFTTKTTDSKRGSGLGLSVVNSVIKDHNGYIDVESIVDKGTSFFIYLPISRKTSDVKNNEYEEYEVRGSETILVVDDDDILQEVMSNILEGLGYKVDVVDSGEEAVEYLLKKSVDIILLDMVMPNGIDGTEAYRQIIQYNPNQKAIIVSGYADSKRVQEARNLGINMFIHKPITQEVLGKAIRKEINRAVKITH